MRLIRIVFTAKDCFASFVAVFTGKENVDYNRYW